MKLKYGNIEADVVWKTPTKEIFESWKKDFFELEDVELFDVYLVGKFVDILAERKKYTKDIDIILTKCTDTKKIEKILYEGTRLGIEKYQVFFDVLWFEQPPSPDFFKMTIKDDKFYIPLFETKIYTITDKHIENGRVKNQYRNIKQIRENLWKIESFIFPTHTQLRKMNNKHSYPKPILLHS